VRPKRVQHLHLIQNIWGRICPFNYGSSSWGTILTIICAKRTVARRVTASSDSVLEPGRSAVRRKKRLHLVDRPCYQANIAGHARKFQTRT
jgi:hypothetical protein